MKKISILTSFLLLAGVLTFSACSGSSSSDSNSIGGVLQNPSSETDSLVSSESSETTSSSESSLEEPIPDYVLGVWNGEDIAGLPVTYTVSKDSAILSFVNWSSENEEYHFTLLEQVNSSVYTTYLYACEEDATINLEFMLYNETEANLSSADREDIIISDLFIPSYGLDFKK